MSVNEELIRKCQKKSLPAFEELYKQFSPIVYGICLRYAKNTDDAQDLLQECFIKIYERIGDFRFEGSFDGWLKRLAVNTALNYLRLDKSFDDYTELPEVADDLYNYDIINDLTAKELLKFVNSLPDGYRAVFNMYVIEGYQHSEIAEILNITESTSRSQLKKAREALKTLINKYYSQ